MNEQHIHDWEIGRQNVHGFLDVWCECACGAVISADDMPAMLVELADLRAKLAAAEARIASLEAARPWQPVGECGFEIGGGAMGIDWLQVSEGGGHLSIGFDNQEMQHYTLPDGYAVCRLVDNK